MDSEIVFSLNSQNVRRFKTTNIGSNYVEERNASEFFQQLSQRALIDTGIMPPGVLSVKQCGEDLQIAIVAPPSKNLLIWGKSEGSATAETYLLAQPYRFMVGEFRSGEFLGARMFYSPVPITSVDNILYHANVPNLNCRGYRGTGVGWVCLYHSHDTTSMTIAEKAAYVGLRCSGNEAYNDDNMSETDGPRFYESKDYPVYTYDPLQWEAKTELNGIDWTLDPNIWIPVLVASVDSQDCHYEGGLPLTVGMVLDGKASYYYNDEALRLSRSITNFDVDSCDLHERVFNAAFNAAVYLGIKEVPKVQEPKPFELPHGDSFNTEESSDIESIVPTDSLNDLATVSMQQLFDAAISPNKTCVIGLSSPDETYSGFHYTLIDSLEIGESVEDAQIVTYVYRNGELLGTHESNYRFQLGTIDGININNSIIENSHYSALMELMYLEEQTIWDIPPLFKASAGMPMPSEIPGAVLLKSKQFDAHTYNIADMIENARLEADNEECEDEDE